MKTKLHQALTLGALLSVAAGLAPAFATDHGSMNHAGRDHGFAGGMDGAAATGGTAAQPARHGVEIRKAVVSGYTLSYNLIDMTQMMQSTSMPMTHGAEKMKSHHLMVYPVAPDGKPATNGKTGYFLVLPDKTEVKTMAMLMDDGFGADVDLVAKGDHRITTKIALDGVTLVDEFVYTVK